MKKNFKKAFTLVELLVVIAILAILATVAIVGYTSFIKEAKLSNDKTVITELNGYLEAASIGKSKVNNPTEAYKRTEKSGLLMSRLRPTTEEFVYGFDLEQQKFCLLDCSKEEWEVQEYDNYKPTEDTNKIFVFCLNKEEVKTANDNGFGVYLQEDGTFDVDLEVSKSTDVGEQKSISSITYKNSEEAQDAVIRTNSTETALTINAENDTVKHYDAVGQLTITAVDPDDCYYENGFVAELVSFGTGKFVVCETAQFHQTMTAVKRVFQENKGTNEAPDWQFKDGVTYEEGKAPQYAQHKWDENGVCEYGHCTGGANGGKAVSDSHTHDFTNGDCACGEHAPSASNATLSFASNGTYGNNWLGNGLVLTTAEAGTITEVKIGGNSVDASNYVLSGENNSIVTINDDYLKTVACTDGRGNAFATGIGYSSAQLVTSNGSTGEEEIKLSGAIYDGAVKTWVEFKELDGMASFGGGTTDTTIGMMGYSYDSNVEMLVIPDTITSFDETVGSCFSGCTNLTKVIYSKNIAASGGNVFDGCSSLTTVIMPEGVSCIGDGTFRNCTSLVNLVLADSVTTIGTSSGAAIIFANCPNLESITFSFLMTELRHQLFTQCPKLTTINYHGTKTQWNSLVANSATDDDGYCWEPTVDENHVTHIAYTVHCTDGDIVVEAH